MSVCHWPVALVVQRVPPPTCLTFLVLIPISASYTHTYIYSYSHNDHKVKKLTKEHSKIQVLYYLQLADKPQQQLCLWLDPLPNLYKRLFCWYQAVIHIPICTMDTAHRHKKLAMECSKSRSTSRCHCLVDWHWQVENCKCRAESQCHGNQGWCKFAWSYGHRRSSCQKQNLGVWETLRKNICK